jgi:Holliday junction resolvase-like predicted endonuclease
VNQWHVGVAAEAFAAGIFARCGFDVSVQYGANQPEYDLIAVKERTLIKVSVKGSQDGGWGLTQSYIKNADYHGAADTWLAKHDPRTLFCLVQFKGVELNQMPRVYLAWPEQIAQHLKRVAKGRGETILSEHRQWTARAFAAGSIDKIPEEWKLSEERLDQILIEARSF